VKNNILLVCDARDLLGRAQARWLDIAESASPALAREIAA